METGNPYVQYMYSYPHKTAYRTLHEVQIKDYVSCFDGQENSLYFHIPFCQYKCGYCNLFSLAGQSETLMEEYVRAMERQAEQIRQALPPRTYFSDLTLGGGTPLILPEYLLERVFRMAEEKFGFCPDGRSVIVETSPNQTTLSKLRLLKTYGTTRVSIGVQSFQEKELRALSRFHSPAAANRALELIRQVGFSRVNIDLIYGIPGQTRESLADSLRQALSYMPEELFIYPLYVKPGTGLDRRFREDMETGGSFDGSGTGTESASDRKICRARRTYELYLFIREELRARGYESRSMRRFVRADAGKQVEEEAPLCGFGNTLSIGCGGRSYLGNLHLCTPYAVGQSRCLEQVRRYIKMTDFTRADHGFLLNEEEQKRRYVIKHIFCSAGLSQDDYTMRFGTSAEKDFPLIQKWAREKYAIIEKNRICLTETGMSLSDCLGPQLISPQVRERMKEWKEENETT